MAQNEWIHYQNSRYGYSVTLPPGLQVSNRAADGSGLTWQTGTVRVQVSGVNNPYSIKPHAYFAGVKAAAGDRVVREAQGQELDFHWYEILYTKESRRVVSDVSLPRFFLDSREDFFSWRSTLGHEARSA